MAKPPNSKAQGRYAGMESLPKFIFPKGQARAKEMTSTAPFAKLKQSFDYPAAPSPSVQLLNTMAVRHPAETYSDGRRNFSSFEAAKAANPDMPLIRKAPSAESEYAAQRDRAFLSSIGSGGFGFGPISYVLGGGPDTIQAAGQLDTALGGLSTGFGLRPAGRPILPRPKAEMAEREVKKWPENNGFLYSLKGELPPKFALDRYGEEGILNEKNGRGRFTAPYGTPYEQRAVGYRPEADSYHAYETVVAVPVEQGPSVPWFGQSGGAWQFLHPENMTTMLASNKIIRKP